MAEITLATPHGALNVHGWRKDTMQAAAELGSRLVQARETHGEFIEFEGGGCYLKAGPLNAGSAWRHGLAAHLLRRKAPRVREYNNLSWLIERHFQAVLPFAAGVFTRKGLPHYQYLLTRRVEDGRQLDEFWLGSSPRERRGVIEELARELARMHALGFLHHDLYVRNLLVRPLGCERRVVFLDAWAGGPPTQLRRPGYDLGALFLEGLDLFGEEEQRELLATYFQQRGAQGRPARIERTLRAAVRARTRLRRQLEREPRRRRGRALPSELWSPRL